MKEAVELDEEETEIVVLPPKKCSRPILLGQKLVQLYLKKVREEGGVVSTRITGRHYFSPFPDPRHIAEV